MKSFFATGRSAYDPLRGASEKIFINNYGYYRDVGEDISVCRLQGRPDWHLIYVSAGSVALSENVSLSPGECYLFAPGDVQKYTYRAEKNSLYYWIHFTGWEIEALFGERGFAKGFHGDNGRRQECEGLWRLLSDALTQKGENAPYPCALLQAILCLLSEVPISRAPFRRAKLRLEETGDDSSVGELAALYHMTPAHFIRSFKAAYGSTPAHYRIRCRIEEAKQLLDGTALSVHAIAELCGFSDALYFSRLFKKNVGVSPMEYRNRPDIFA